MRSNLTRIMKRLPPVFPPYWTLSMTSRARYSGQRIRTGAPWYMQEIRMGMHKSLFFREDKSYIGCRFHRTVVTLCNPGEHILVEEWTYPSAMTDCQGLGILPAPVKVDGEGLSAVDLEYVLSTWEENARNSKRCGDFSPESLNCPYSFSRPHVLYTIPVGQNPTGAVSVSYLFWGVWPTYLGMVDYGRWAKEGYIWNLC